MKLCFLSTQAFSMPTLQYIARGGQHEVTVCSITPERADQSKVAGYGDYEALAGRLGLPFRAVEAFNLASAADEAFFQAQRFDAILALGWNRLIPDAILESTQLGAIGSHTSPHDLPFGRGRSPVVWAIALGFARVTSNLFQIDTGIDTGKVLASKVLPVGPEDTTQILYYKIAMSHAAMLDKGLASLQSETGAPASELPDLEFPKRGPEDAVIDWSLPAGRLHDLVRAVAPPFHGAFFQHGGVKHHLFRTRVWDGPEVTGEAGEVIAIFPDGAMIVATGDGALLCLEHDCDTVGAGMVLT